MAHRAVNPRDGVRRVVLTTGPVLHPLSTSSANADQNYYCLAYDLKGFQYQIDLQALPAGITIEQLKPNQVWWVEKRTSLYRLYLYCGTYNSSTRRITTGTLTVPGVYGQFISKTTQTLTAANTPTLVQLDTTIYSNLTALSGNKIYVQASGLYNLQFSAQLSQTDNLVYTVYIWPRQNGVDVPWSNTEITMDRANGSKVASWNWYLQANTGDYFQLYWDSIEGTAPQILGESSTGYPNMPAVPSVIATINRISS